MTKETCWAFTRQVDYEGHSPPSAVFRTRPTVEQLLALPEGLTQEQAEQLVKGEWCVDVDSNSSGWELNESPFI
jgi:hypothetical protein